MPKKFLIKVHEKFHSFAKTRKNISGTIYIAGYDTFDLFKDSSTAYEFFLIDVWVLINVFRGINSIRIKRIRGNIS
ncbi:MAG: hypothetical protein ACOCWG_00385, partial [bacterium]